MVGRWRLWLCSFWQLTAVFIQVTRVASKDPTAAPRLASLRSSTLSAVGPESDSVGTGQYIVKLHRIGRERRIRRPRLGASEVLGALQQVRSFTSRLKYVHISDYHYTAVPLVYDSGLRH